MDDTLLKLSLSNLLYYVFCSAHLLSTHKNQQLNVCLKCTIFSIVYLDLFTSYSSHFEGNRYGRGGGERYGPPTRSDYRLIVENLSSRCSWQDLKVQSMHQ